MPCVVGMMLSLGVALFARRVGFDRDRAFYPTVLIVIASSYVLFAAMSGSGQTVSLGVNSDGRFLDCRRSRVQVERMDRRCRAGRGQTPDKRLATKLARLSFLGYCRETRPRRRGTRRRFAAHMQNREGQPHVIDG